MKTKWANERGHQRPEGKWDPEDLDPSTSCAISSTVPLGKSFPALVSSFSIFETDVLLWSPTAVMEHGTDGEGLWTRGLDRQP